MLPVLALPLALDASPPPALRAERAPSTVIVDGRLDEPAWVAAEVGSKFTQKVPTDGAAPSEGTRVRVLYDEKAIYVAVECDQQDAPIVAPLTRRDRAVETDSVSISLATRGDGTSAFQFTVNPRGVLADASRFNDTELSQEWDENWEGSAQVTPTGWSAELRIPLRILRFEEKPVQSFGLQVRRYTSAKKEVDEWAHIPRDVTGEVSRYGRLENLVALRKGSTLELRPFVVAKALHRDPEAAPLSIGFSPAVSAGIDAKWQIMPSLTLDMTVNPDFGQVDADRVVLNLSNFENYLSERRPFFLEAADVFSTPVELFYTRRVGKGVFAPELPGQLSLLTTPDPAPIYGALKLTGTINEKWALGGLFAVTGSTGVLAASGPGNPYKSFVAEPPGMYRVLRVRRTFEGGSTIGAIFTAATHMEDTAAYPEIPGPPGKRATLCPSGDVVARGRRCFHDAFVAGIDGKWRSDSRDYSVGGQIVGTLTHEGPGETQLDGTVIRSGDMSPLGRLDLRKEGGGHTRGGITLYGVGPKANYNDLGYMRRQNTMGFDAWTQYNSNGKFGPMLDAYAGAYAWDEETLRVINLGRGGGAFVGVQLPNFWRAEFEVGTDGDYADDREIGDGAVLERPGNYRLWASLVTDESKPVAFKMNGGPKFLSNGGVGFFVDSTLTVRALPQLELTLSPGATYIAGETRFVGTDDANYLFGKLEAGSLSATLSATYTFAPRLTLQLYSQGFLAFGTYTDPTVFQLPSSAIAPGDLVIRLADLQEPESPVDLGSDFLAGALNANVVLRWEYRLGSTLFLVYSHAQSDDATPGRHDRGSFPVRFAAPRQAAEVFLIKASYWWGG